MSGTLLFESGIETVGDLQELGWKETLERTARRFPEALNLNFAAAIIGVELNCDWREIPSALKAEAKGLIQQLKAELR